MRIPVLPIRVLLAAAVALAACDGESGSGNAPAGTGALADRRPESEQVQRLTGLSHLPAPESPRALAASMRRHYPAEFIGTRPRTAVLVDVTVSASGAVQDVRVVDRTGMDADDNVRAVVLQKVPGTSQVVERELNATYDPAFGPAAQAALREVRFLPAIRDGAPVPYTLRMTVEFTDPGPPA